MIAHTPGPWVYEPGPRGDPDMPDAAFIIVGPGETGEVVATVVGPVHPGALEANAKLIATAPDMAAVLLSAWQHVSHGGPKRGDVEDVLRKAGLIQ